MKPYIHQSGKSAEELYQATLKREESLKSLGYNVVSIFECQFKKIMDGNEEIRNFVNNVTVEKRLDPRDAFLGKKYYLIKTNSE